MPTIIIDNKPYEVKAGSNLLEACLGAGIDLPYFCWHPALGSVGACRQCAVKLFKDEQDSTGRIVMSCMEAVKDGARLSVTDKTAKAFREQVIEWLMTNHPHDCPVCDEGGSCHLQDMTVMTGHDYRRYKYKKRTYTNQYLGPLIHHEMNRCIQCYRCVRYYHDYAGGKDLNVFAAHNHVYFGREKDGVLESPFSGNLAEICPTGVFTDKTLKKHYTRKWDLTTSPSICQHCGVGCNIIAGERYGQLRNVLNRYHSEVNGYFLCDRGRFGYEFVNDVNRITQPIIRYRTIEAVDEAALMFHLKHIINNNPVIGIGSPRASLETNYSLLQLVGKENFFSGISEDACFLQNRIVDILQKGGIHSPSLKDLESADAVIVLGEDIWNTAPIMALSVRQAVTKAAARQASGQISLASWNDAAIRERVQENKGYLAILSVAPSPLDEIGTDIYRQAPDDLARMGFAIANAIDNGMHSPEGMTAAEATAALRIADALQQATNVVVISGMSACNEGIIKAAGNLAQAIKNSGRNAGLSFVMPECNSMGLALMKAPPLEKAIEKLARMEPVTAIIAENDLYRYNPAALADRFLESCANVIALDAMNNRTTGKAQVIIPAATFAEADGTLINNEGRAQHFYQAFMPSNPFILESWKWIWKLKTLRSGNANGQEHFPEELLEKMEHLVPAFQGVSGVTPPHDFRIHGQPVPREPQRYSGRTAMLANLAVSEPKPLQDEDSPLTFTMEGFQGIPPAPLIPFYWRPGWNSVQALNKYQQEIGGKLKGGDPGVRLFDNKSNGTPLTFKDPPEAFHPRPGKWLLLPQYNVYGSGELSSYTAALEALVQAPFVAISAADAAGAGLTQGSEVVIETAEEKHRLPLQVVEQLPNGVALVSAGIRGMPAMPLGNWIKIIV